MFIQWLGKCGEDSLELYYVDRSFVVSVECLESFHQILAHDKQLLSDLHDSGQQTSAVSNPLMFLAIIVKNSEKSMAPLPVHSYFIIFVAVLKVYSYRRHQPP